MSIMIFPMKESIMDKTGYIFIVDYIWHRFVEPSGILRNYKCVFSSGVHSNWNGMIGCKIDNRNGSGSIVLFIQLIVLIMIIELLEPFPIN